VGTSLPFLAYRNPGCFGHERALAGPIALPDSRHPLSFLGWDVQCGIVSILPQLAGANGMSWDVFVQDIPASATSVDEIPDDFIPSQIGTRAAILDVIRSVLPFADMSDPSWIRVHSHAIDLEISLRETDPVESFAFHVRGGEHSIGAIAEILARLGLRALDPGAQSGILDPSTAVQSLARWQAYRDRALKG
jgi:hypothetical protein